MEVLGVTTGVAGVGDVAIRGITQLHRLITNFFQADEEAKAILTDLQTITTSLDALRDLSASDAAISVAALSDLKKAKVGDAVIRCDDACALFSKELKRWTKHSGGSKLGFRDKLSVGIFKREEARTLKAQVHACQNTVQIAVESAQLLIELRTVRKVEVDHEKLTTQLQSLETKIGEHLDHVKVQQERTLDRRQRLDAAAEDEDNEDGYDLEQLFKGLEANRVCCETLSKKIHSALSGQEIGNVATSQDSVAWVGLPESVVGRINQRIESVTTDANSASYVGVFGSGFQNLVLQRSM